MNDVRKVFSWIWVLWVFCTFIVFQPDVLESVVKLPYWMPMSGILVLGVSGHFILKSWNNEVNWRHAYWLPLVLLMSALIIPSFYSINNIEANSMPLKLLYFSFFSTILILGLLLIFSAAWAIGDKIIGLVNVNAFKDRHLLAMTLGISVQTTIVTVFGLVGLFSVYLLFTIIILSLISNYKKWWAFIWDTFLKPRKISLTSKFEWPIFLALLACVAISWIAAIKAFPSGNDGASLYMSLTNKIVDSGSLPAGGQAFSWSVYMAFGSIFKGTESLSILLSHSMGYLSLIALYVIVRRWFSQFHSLLLITFVFLSPYFAFHVIIDEKVDLALLFFTLVIINIATDKTVLGLIHNSDNTNRYERVLAIILIAWLCGFAFTIKYSVVILLVGLLTIMFFNGFKAAIAGTLIILGVFFLGNLLVSSAAFSGQSDLIVSTTILMISGASLLFMEKGAWAQIKKGAPLIGIFFLTFLLPFTPWGIKNTLENNVLSMESILEGKAEKPRLLTNPNLIGYHDHLEEKKINYNPLWDLEIQKPQLISDFEQLATQPNAKDADGVREELQRYLGFEAGIWRLLSLPFDLTYSINIPNNRYLIIGFVFLALIPIFFFINGGIVSWILFAIGGILWISFSLFSINQYSAASQSASEILLMKDMLLSQVTEASFITDAIASIFINPMFGLAQVLSPIYDFGAQISQNYSGLILILTTLGFSYLLRPLFTSHDSELKKLLFIVLSGCLTWWIFGMGVVWYALYAFVLLPILVILPLTKGPDTIFRSRWIKILFGSTIGIQLLIFFLMYFTNQRITGEPESLYKWPDLEYATEPSLDTDDILYKYNHTYKKLFTRINQDPEAKIYLVNTQLVYHIDNYDARVYEDNLLMTYRDAKRKHGEDLDFGKILSGNGYKYVLFDILSYTLDKTPERVYAETCRRFINEMVLSNYAQLVVTDNYVYDDTVPMMTLPNGQKAKARPGVTGIPLKKGTYVLFRIK